MTLDFTAPGPTAGHAPAQRVISPAILYLGTPVALVSTLSASGAPNLMPLPSSFFLGRTGPLGVGARSQTAVKLRERGECVITFPSLNMLTHVSALALTTGRDPETGRGADEGECVLLRPNDAQSL
jgi:flavin reductase (DIM6/NTAB) family NADH-FMN oxidoreductase RutF